MYNLFSILLPDREIRSADGLYFHGSATLSEDKLLFKKGESATFDTYFNCFSYSKYKRYTDVNSLCLVLTLKGDLTVKVYRSELSDGIAEAFSSAKKRSHKNPNKNTDLSSVVVPKTLLCSKTCKSADEKEFTIDIDLEKFGGTGNVWFELDSKGDSEFFGGHWACCDTPKQSVKVGIVICTYKREAFVSGNMQRVKCFLDENADLKDKLEFFIIDNGQTLEPSRYDFVKVYPNANLGGSGGFTRGIIEVYQRKDEFTHFLLMDDDIVFHAEILRKLVGILEYASDTKRLSVGGSLLKQEAPAIQHEMGANWNGIDAEPENHDFDLALPIDILRNEKDKMIDYNGWWFMCMPLSVVDKHLLPLPLFIKSDDMEYGLRCAEDVMLVNGLGVWHESFQLKYTSVLEYYQKRNELILNSVCDIKRPLYMGLIKLVRSVAKQLIYQRYFALDFIFDAYDDFLKGPQYIMTLNAEDLHRKLLKNVPKFYSGRELAQQGYNVKGDPYKGGGNKIKNVLTLNGHLLPTFCYNKKERTQGRLVHLTKCVPQDFYKSALTVQYDSEYDRGFVTKQSRAQVIKTGFRLLGMGARLMIKHHLVAKQFRAKRKELASFENWYKLLGINSETYQKMTQE